MANQKIHEYIIERFAIGDDDFFDIDYFDGAVYRTAKIKGSVVKAIAAGVNIYNSDGALLTDRTIDGNNFGLEFQNLNFLSANVLGLTPQTDLIQIAGNPTNVISGTRLLSILDIIANKRRFAILKTGEVQINEAYNFPLTDGANGEILVTDGAGNLTFQPAPTSSNFYNSNGALTTDRIVSGSFFNLWFLDHNGFIFQTSDNGTDTQNGVWFDIEENNVLNGGTLFKIRKKGGAGVGVDRFAVLKNGQVEINEEYTLPLTDGTIGQALVTDGSGAVSFQNVVDNNYVNFGQTQWSVTAPATTLPTGAIANGFSFFTEANKVVAGTTAYDEYFLSWGRVLTLTGTSGSANINILGVDYPINFAVSTIVTAGLFVSTNQATLNALGIQIFAIGPTIKFGSLNQTDLSTITITNTAGTLNGTLNTEVNDHVVIPYNGTAYAGQRLSHNIRINFNIDVGNEQRYALSLRRWQDNSVIGSIIQVERNTTLTGQQEVFLSYTAGASDPFVTGGFYFALENNSGQSVTISGAAGILIITEYQKPIKF